MESWILEILILYNSYWQKMKARPRKAWCKLGERFEFPSLNAFLPIGDLGLSK